MKFRQGEERSRRGKNWMSAMGILFIVMAAIIALRNLYFVTTNLSFAFYLDNYTNAQINQREICYRHADRRRDPSVLGLFQKEGGLRPA